MRKDRRIGPVRRRTLRRPRRENGAVAIMAVSGLIIICAFCGLALDFSRIYNRKMELQNAADPAAVAAAIELDGTKAGIARAVTRASGTFGLPIPLGAAYGYGKHSMDWSESAIEFGPSPNGPWFTREIAAGKTEPNGLLYVKVDTAGLETAYGELTTWFLPVVSQAMKTASTSARAIAGPSGIAVSPLGICAMGSLPKRNRGGELEEFGFRRGVSYDLMQLNTEDSEAGQSFLIHPYAGPMGALANDFNSVAPFVCTGTLAMSRLTEANLSVTSPFPLNDLWQQLNSRFDSYTSPCDPETAPPDTNVKQYVFNDGSVPWMATTPEGQAAKLYKNGRTRGTVASPDATPAGTLASQYGPLWTYAKAVKYADPVPASGYVAYTASNTDWATLYNPGKPTVAPSKYPSSTPYAGTGTFASYTSSPSHPGLRDRRVLNVALLACPVSAGKVSVKGIGRFFMTVRADQTHLYAEFAGAVEEQTLRTGVKLFR